MSRTTFIEWKGTFGHKEDTTWKERGKKGDTSTRRV